MRQQLIARAFEEIRMKHKTCEDRLLEAEIFCSAVEDTALETEMRFVERDKRQQAEIKALTNRAETAEMDAKITEEAIEKMDAEIERLQQLAIDNQDLALEHYGTLLAIRSWLLGELPEATAEQMIDLCGKAKQPKTIIVRRALDSEREGD